MNERRIATSGCVEPDLKELFVLFIDGDVGPEERRRIEDHLQSCINCQEELEFLLDLRELRLNENST